MTIADKILWLEKWILKMIYIGYVSILLTDLLHQLTDAMSPLHNYYLRFRCWNNFADTLTSRVHGIDLCVFILHGVSVCPSFPFFSVCSFSPFDWNVLVPFINYSNYGVYPTIWLQMYPATLWSIKQRQQEHNHIGTILHKPFGCHWRSEDRPMLHETRENIIVEIPIRLIGWYIYRLYWCVLLSHII